MIQNVFYRTKAGTDTHHVVKRPDEHQHALEVIVPQAGLPVELAVREDGGGVEDGRERREARRDEGADP